MSERRIRIILSYDGSNYHGWQVQPGLETIQATLEGVLAQIEGAPVRVEASGRTDAGVHALAQVAAFNLANPIPPENLRKAINRLLPRDIRVLCVEEAAADFHPRFHARAKTYEYRILRAEVCPPFDRLYVHHHPYPLNEAAMIELAPLLEGEHDFFRLSPLFRRSGGRDGAIQSPPDFFVAAGTVRGAFDLPRSRQRIFETHGAQHCGRAAGGWARGNLDRAGFEARLAPGCEIPPGLPLRREGCFWLASNIKLVRTCMCANHSVPLFLLLVAAEVSGFPQSAPVVTGAGYSLPAPVNVAPGQVLTIFAQGIGSASDSTRTSGGGRSAHVARRHLCHAGAGV